MFDMIKFFKANMEPKKVKNDRSNIFNWIMYCSDYINWLWFVWY